MSEEPPQDLGPGPNADDFDPKQHLWDGRNWWTWDVKYWWDGTRWQPRDVAAPAPTPVERKPRPPGYRRDFWLGFFGAIAGNVVLFIVIGAVGSATYGQAGSFLRLLPWILNIGGLIVFAIVRTRVALGMLLAYGIAFGLVLLAGIFLLVLCFGMSHSGP